MGHYSNECPIKNDKLNKIEKYNVSESKLDIDVIFIEGRKYNATFDTGASDSVITSKILNKIKHKKIFKKNENFTLINGANVSVKRAINIEFQYKHKIFNEIFYIVENDRMDEILLSNSLVKKLRSEINFNIECCIDTTNHAPIRVVGLLDLFAINRNFKF